MILRLCKRLSKVLGVVDAVGDMAVGAGVVPRFKTTGLKE